MITTIFFDLGNVIIPFDNARLADALFAAALKNADVQGCWRHLLREHETGRLSEASFYEKYCSATASALSIEEFRRIATCHFAEKCAFDVSFLRRLRRRYSVFALSNTNDIHMRFVLDKFPVMREFDDYIRSDKVGALKPAVKIFNAALKRARAKPSECVFIDDIKRHVAAAEGVGMHGIWFRSEPQARAALRNLGVR